MFRTLLRRVVLVSTVAVGTAALADAQVGFIIPPDREAAIEAAYQAGKASGDFSRVREELIKVFKDPDADVQGAGLTWIGRHLQDLTSAQQREFRLLLPEVNPSSTIGREVRASVAGEEFQELPQRERERWYWQAVRGGKVFDEGVYDLPRALAISLAVLEGLESFAPLVAQYADEINSSRPHSAVKDSETLAWHARLRAGAKSRVEANRQEIARFGGMDDATFGGLMDSDLAFRGVVDSDLSVSCHDGQSDQCLELAGLTERQIERYKRRHGGSAEGVYLGPPSDIGTHPETWLERMAMWTYDARSKLQREKYRPTPKNR